jgi:fructan beta-fructosidase
MTNTYRLIFAVCLFSLTSTTMAQEQFSHYFTPEKKYLVLPVKNGAPKKNLELWLNGNVVRFFDMELADGKADWLAYLDISEWKGKPIELRVDKLDKNSQAFQQIEQTDNDEMGGKQYSEELRGQFHFSPKRGWTNDPNGMCFFKGEYHLFFQHNPYGRGWGNMTWGHAVSKDMVHWKEIGDAIHPDGFGPMFSGSAVVDSFNTSGLGDAGNPAMVMFFTGARAWGQGLAWTTNGRSFQKLDHTVVNRINKDNRDPKVFWHAPGKHWVMVLWVERENGLNSMQFLTSPDLKNWTRASVINGGVREDRYLFECPDFYELEVEGKPGEKKWILSAANSMYAIGTFDGTTFKPETERQLTQVGRDYYAAQTFSNEPSGRRIEIGWWRTHTDKGNSNFNQSMSVPMELKLVQTSNGLRVKRVPITELESLRGERVLTGAVSLTDKSKNPASEVKADLLEIIADLKPGTAKKINFVIHGLELRYDVVNQELLVDGIKAKTPLEGGHLRLRIFADRTGLEVFAQDGLIFMPVNKNLSSTVPSLAISVQGGKVKFTKLDVYALKSAWE